MNQYQKFATLILRLFGAVVVVVGVMGPLYIGFLVALGKDAPTYGPDRWAGSIVWGLAGVLLIVFSKNLGRLFGRVSAKYVA